MQNYYNVTDIQLKVTQNNKKWPQRHAQLLQTYPKPTQNDQTKKQQKTQKVSVLYVLL